MMKILVIGPSWIGDTVMSHSVYQLLSIRYRYTIKIDVMIPKWCFAIVNRMPEINKILFIPYKHGTLELIKCFNIGKNLRNKKYHQAIILPNSFKSALIPFFAGIIVRTGWQGEMRYGVLNDLRVLDPMAWPLMVQRYAALACDCTVRHFSKLPVPFPWPSLRVKKKEIEKVLFKFDLNSCEKQLIGLCFGSGFGPAKIWPHYHYVQLATYLVDLGYRVVILGFSKNQLIHKFFENSVLKKIRKYCINIINKTSLDEVISIISICKGVVSNDSGLLHVACALQRPVVGLYGPSDPGFTPPLFNQAIVLRCVNGSYKIRKGDNNLYGYHHSLINISPNRVLTALQVLLD